MSRQNAQARGTRPSTFSRGGIAGWAALGLVLGGCSTELLGPDGNPVPTDGAGAQPGTGSAPGSGGGTSTGGDSVAGCANPDVGPTVLRRLSALEYRLTVQDLLALDEPPEAKSIPLDNERLGFRTFAEYQTMSADNLRGYLDQAGALARDLLLDETRKAAVFGCAPSAPTCLDEFVARFGKLAYRRPLEAAEQSALTSAAQAAGLDAEDQFAFVIEALLSSSNFLYRVEVGDTPDGLSSLDSFELASKLSFALWGRGPNEQLMDSAAAGQLDTPEGLATIAEGMLADARTQFFFEQFFRQWLGYQTLKPPTPAEEAVFVAMQEETDRLVEEFAWGTGRFLDVLTANHSYVSPALADYYGLDAPDADGRLEFDSEHPRADSGLLTHAALLSAKTDGDLIAMRGTWVLETFLCEEMHIPADLADTIGELLVGLDRVGIVSARNTRSECLGCHSVIDPIGIGFGSFDRTGVFDPEEDPSIFGIDAALPLAPKPNQFQTVGELSAQLSRMPEVAECLGERAFLYMHGREPAAIDQCAGDRINQAFASGGENLPGLLEALVEDPTFRLRRAPEVEP